jgi:hypothetical protein
MVGGVTAILSLLGENRENPQQYHVLPQYALLGAEDEVGIGEQIKNKN